MAAPVHWCEDEELLSSIFGGFSHLEAPSLQTPDACSTYAALLLKFLAKHQVLLMPAASLPTCCLAHHGCRCRCLCLSRFLRGTT
jgi:hypothetical protein